MSRAATQDTDYAMISELIYFHYSKTVQQQILMLSGIPGELHSTGYQEMLSCSTFKCPCAHYNIVTKITRSGYVFPAGISDS